MVGHRCPVFCSVAAAPERPIDAEMPDSYPDVAEEVLVARHEQIPPATLARPEAVRQLPQVCSESRDSAQIRRIMVELGPCWPISANSVQLLSKFHRAWPTRANFGPQFANVGQVRPHVAQMWARTWQQLGPTRPFAEFGPNLASLSNSPERSLDTFAATSELAGIARSNFPGRMAGNCSASSG